MSSEWLGVVGRAAIPVAVLAAFALLRRGLPARSCGNNWVPISPELLGSFRRTQWYVGTALLGVGITFGVSLYFSLVALNHHYAATEGPARFQLFPTRAIWGFFPGFAALTLCWEITLSLWSLVGDRTYISQYLNWSDQQLGFDSTRAFRWLALLITLPVAVVTLLATPMHSTVHDSEIHVRHFASMRSIILPYSVVQRITEVAGVRMHDGTFKSRPDLVVDFRGGRRWRSADNRDYSGKANETNVILNQKMAEFLERRTGVTIESAETERDIPVPKSGMN